MTEESMVERVARAIVPELWPEGAAASAAENGMVIVSPAMLEKARSVARAAILAMREPTPEMTRAVANVAWHSGSGINPAAVWAAGVDEALRP